MKYPILILILVSHITIVGAASPSKLTLTQSFDGGLSMPDGWRADATGGKAADWHVTRDAGASSPPNVLTIARLNDKSRGNFNLYWSPAVRFHSGNIEVNIRARSGAIDQGGGIIWRVQDANNYYLARYNPLERNLRLYYVKNGTRRMLADAPNLTVGSNEWFMLKISHHNHDIEALLNGTSLIRTTDNTFTKTGGVGLWSKADAISTFDNLTIVHAVTQYEE